jgi:glutamate formiminotransferase/formiminotetrahydrofolate cyclodeaminase
VEQKSKQIDPGQMVSWPISEFLRKLASEEPVPGGGSVSALAGALGAALIVMYCRIGSHRKGVSGDDQEALQKISIEATSYEQKLTRLITDDSAAYAEVTDAFKLPKTTEEENKVRQAAIQKAFKKAIDAPFQTLSDCLECLYLISEVSVLGNPSAFSDLKVAKYLCQAGARGAMENIEINLPYVKDAEYLKHMEARMTKLKDALEKISRETIAAPA